MNEAGDTSAREATTATRVYAPAPAATSSRPEPATAPSPGPKGIARDYFETIVICVIFVIFSRAFVFQQSKIPTGSMEDTLLIGDYIMVNRFAYAPAPTRLETALLPVRDVRRGDIIVFKYPEEPEIDYIKRVIGLPGDTVDVRAGIVSINGRRLEEPYLDTAKYPDTHSFWGPKTVPPDSFFVMGDCRNNSRDSRVWGFVPRHFIKGRAFIIWFSYAEDRNEYTKTGVERGRSILNKLLHPARARWSRCFTLIR